jgi:prepilin-type N-terminal cleavage/methylation domain-containing protein
MMKTMNRQLSPKGFSLIELIMVIVIISILTVTAVSKWPSGLGEDAAAMEFRRAVRYAQHMAITQQWTSADAAWGIVVSGNKYTVQRADGSEQETSLEYSGRNLLGNSSMTITDGSVYFNGLGEPIYTTDGVWGPAGTPCTSPITFTIGTSTTVRVYQETGYVE